MKRTIIDTCALTSFILVVALGASAIRIQLTQDSRDKQNQEWMRGVVEQEVIKQIKFMMPSSTGTVVK